MDVGLLSYCFLVSKGVFLWNDRMVVVDDIYFRGMLKDGGMSTILDCLNYSFVIFFKWVVLLILVKEVNRYTLYMHDRQCSAVLLKTTHLLHCSLLHHLRYQSTNISHFSEVHRFSA